MQELLKLIAKPVAAANLFTPSDAAAVGLSINDVSTAVTNGIKAIVAVAGVIFFVMLVWGGVQYVLSGGDKAATQAARDRITYALIGIVIVAAAFAIATLVGTVTGTSITNVSINNLYT